MLSHVLMNKQLRHPGMPAHLPVVGPLSSTSVGGEAQDISSIVLALRTLGSFNFDGKLQFLKLLKLKLSSLIGFRISTIILH